MKTKNRLPKPGTKAFSMAVMPDRDHLDVAIADNGHCTPRKCWHRVAIFAILLGWNPHARASDVRVDAGHVKINYGGWRYISDTPLHVKRSLMLFDRKKYDEVQIRGYNLHFRRTTKIVPLTEAQREKNRDRYLDRITDPRPRPPHRPVTNLRKRVEGFSSVV